MGMGKIYKDVVLIVTEERVLYIQNLKKLKYEFKLDCIERVYVIYAENG